MEDAYSDNIRQKISDWFYGEVLPRARPGARVVGIGTRFHHADLFAELEASGRYKVIRLSAVAEEDDELGRARRHISLGRPARHLPIRGLPAPAARGAAAAHLGQPLHEPALAERGRVLQGFMAEDVSTTRRRATP